jgi:PAS domain S-box-containing protein
MEMAGSASQIGDLKHGHRIPSALPIMAIWEQNEPKPLVLCFRSPSMPFPGACVDMPTEPTLRHRHELILDALTEGVFTVDLDWRITSFNRAAERITGIPRVEAIGRHCFEVLRADICESDCVLRRTMETRHPLSNVPVHVYRADKRRIPINVSTTLLRDDQDRVIGGVETFEDMSTIRELQKALGQNQSFDDIVSQDPKMLRIFGILPQVAESLSTILIQGASGTGKELIARAIHHHSAHRKGPFVAINCGALPDTLIESELFGYKAGAFTDAKHDKPGRFAMARMERSSWTRSATSRPPCRCDFCACCRIGSMNPWVPTGHCPPMPG